MFRAPMRSRDDGIVEGAAVERALTLGVCGVGGRLERVPSSITEALGAVDTRHGERLARRLERFASAPDGAFVWTRDVEGLLWLGRLAGPWRYDPTVAADAVDLVHVRPSVWAEVPIDASEVPAAVRATFARGGRNWQRVHDPEVSARSAALWEQRAGA